MDLKSEEPGSVVATLVAFLAFVAAVPLFVGGMTAWQSGSDFTPHLLGFAVALVTCASFVIVARALDLLHRMAKASRESADAMQRLVGNLRPTP